MSMLELRLKVQFSDSEVTSILNNAEEFKIPVIEYDPETLQDQVNEVIKIQDLGYVKEVILYADPVIAHPSMIQSLSVHHHKMRKVLNPNIRIRNKAYIVRVSSIGDSMLIGNTFYPIAVIDATKWIEAKSADLIKLNVPGV